MYGKLLSEYDLDSLLDAIQRKYDSDIENLDDAEYELSDLKAKNLMLEEEIEKLQDLILSERIYKEIKDLTDYKEYNLS